MKIGYARLGFPVELEVKKGSISTLGTEIREGLIYDWLELGYEVIVVSELKKEDEALINRKLNLFEKNWFNKIKYSPKEIPELDVLFIECGSSNPLYQGQYGSFEQRIEYLINNFNGRIIYYQHGHLPFDFLNKVDKEIIIIHHFQNSDLFKQEFKYKNSKLKYKFIPLGYSDVDIKLKASEKPIYDLIWIGGENDSNKKSGTEENTRVPLLKKYFQNKNYNSVIIGRWSEETKKELKNVNFLGALGKHGDAYKYFNSSYLTMWGGSKSTKKTGLIPTRPIMALLSSSIVVAEKDMFNVDKLISQEFLITNSEDIEKILLKVKSLNVSQRTDVCLKELKNFPKWTELNWKEIFEI